MVVGVNSRTAGFSLIELVVVVAILSFLTVTASLTVGQRGEGGQADATFLQNQFEQLRSAAVYSQIVRGLKISPTGMQIVEFDPEDGRWKDVGREFKWRGRLSLRLKHKQGGNYLVKRPDEPDVVFLTSGQTTAFTAAFTGGQDNRVCQTDGWTGLNCAAR